MKELHTFVVLAYKESSYLEKCIKSVLNQTVKTNVVIGTSTPNNHIEKLAKKYNLKVIVNKSEKKGIGYDFDFAKNCVDSELVTIAHQDDIYDREYAQEVIEYYKKYPKSLILFSNYYEIKGKNKEYKNTNLNIKKFLLIPLRFRMFSGLKAFKRSAIRIGNAICCPAVTFVNDNCTKEVFASDMKCNIDWLAWERLSKLKGNFIYINKYLMGHRIHEESTTTEIINDNNRSKEDLIMFKKFWPTPIAKLLTRLYKKSESNNKIK